MRMFSKHLFAALMGAAVLSSCSRPVAYFQRGPVAHYATQTQTAAPVTPSPTADATAPAVVAPVATPAPAEQVAQVSTAVEQLDALVRNDSKLAADKKLTKRMAKVKALLASADTKAALAAPAATSAKKMSLMERMVMKKIDKKLNRTLAPDQTHASSNTRLGLIIGVIGIILILVGAIAGVGALTVIGLIGLIVGLVLLLLGLANNS